MKPASFKRFPRLLAELAVFLSLYAIGGQLAAWLGWPIPGGVMGLALLLMAEMLLFFIPALMSLLDYGSLLRDDGWRILLVIAVSTLMVMVMTAVTVEWVCRWRMRHDA
ncbi:holin-like protein [compost metagenome]